MTGMKTAIVVTVEAKSAPNTCCDGLARRLLRFMAFVAHADEIFENDDCGVEHHAGREGEARERDHVDRAAGEH